MYIYVSDNCQILFFYFITSSLQYWGFLVIELYLQFYIFSFQWFYKLFNFFIALIRTSKIMLINKLDGEHFCLLVLFREMALAYMFRMMS